MSKKISFLIIGFGSIGRRHFANLQTLGYQQVTVYDPLARVLPVSVPSLDKLSLAALKKFEVVFVCSPTQLHLKQATLAARAGCHLFIEKPLAPNLVGVDKLINLCERQALVTMVACNFRFHHGFKKLQQLVKSGELGQPLTSNVVIGHNLVESRPGVDYRQTYAALPAGGGVILDSGVHALDYLIELFGEIDKITGFYGQVSDLELKTEDFASLVFKHSHQVVSTLTLDYFSQPKRHRVEIQFSAGRAMWDFVTGEVAWYATSRSKWQNLKSNTSLSLEEQRNLMYLEELKIFMELVNKKPGVTNPQDLDRAKQVLTTLMMIKRSAKKI